MIFLWKHFKTMIYLQNNVEKWLKKTSSYTERERWPEMLLLVFPLWTQIEFHYHSSFRNNNHECQYTSYANWKGPDSARGRPEKQQVQQTVQPEERLTSWALGGITGVKEKSWIPEGFP